jgi:DNA-binding MarR family transcriptional regulator
LTDDHVEPAGLPVSDASRELALALERLFLGLIRRTDRLQHLDPEPMPLTAKLALITIADHGPLRIGALAHALNTTEATASRTVDGLARLGFVVRAASPSDKRGVTVEVTPHGHERAAVRRAAFASQVSAVFADVEGGEQRRVADLLLRVARHMDEEENGIVVGGGTGA